MPAICFLSASISASCAAVFSSNFFSNACYRCSNISCICFNRCSKLTELVVSCSAEATTVHRQRAENTPNNSFSFIFNFSTPAHTNGVHDGSNGIAKRTSSQQKLTGQSDWGGSRNRWGASGGKTFNSRSKNEFFQARSNWRRGDCGSRRQSNHRRVKLAMREQSIGALVFCLARVWVE